ncbi:dienelactone hydrolase family protein [Flavobacterium cauense R2A-7]|uniref:Dienelactone hydrolase n=1 Tax=Flavobacterium cauense R2A-7 TaxID=1341154 RepID=V6S211_9FLAO|nr:dienelactone hydrolase family protein [Flavobacterium cauense]ESU18430.1 dienelactone hydrolase family protein [Flavobacterium cauense R2A-7]KGO79463.1 dienelactone hydrolase [Flavobacterium cauense R2A-7]TWI08087.1 dienelactone hydrolase [Flavobacterium cauense R2A-7]
MKSLKFIITLCVALSVISCKTNSSATNNENSTHSIVEENITYQDGDTPLKGVIYYDNSIENNRPAIMVVHEWWGNNDYAKRRAKMLAELGYVAMAIDMYGNGLVVDNPKDAQENAGKYYANPALLKSRVQAAYDVLSKHAKVNKSQISSMGYCFGGTVSLSAASMGIPLKTVVSVHGGLSGFQASPAMKDTKILICHGGNDKFVPQKDVDNFNNEMKKNGNTYEFKIYPEATHAFSNVESTEAGKKFNLPIAYNEAADKQSWQDMLEFFKKYNPIQ